MCVCLVLCKTASVCACSNVTVCVCVSISVMGGNIDFKDIGGGQIQFIHHCCFREVVFKAVLVQTFLPHLFFFDFTF